MKIIIFLVACLAGGSAFGEEKYEVRPSVWGTEKWYGGYEVYSRDKKIGEIRPSVWGTEKWPGGYELYMGNKKVGEAEASVWGQDKWYGGYEIKVNSERDGKILKSILK
jgi:hypothetical protein